MRITVGQPGRAGPLQWRYSIRPPPTSTCLAKVASSIDAAKAAEGPTVRRAVQQARKRLVIRHVERRLRTAPSRLSKSGIPDVPFRRSQYPLLAATGSASPDFSYPVHDVKRLRGAARNNGKRCSAQSARVIADGMRARVGRKPGSSYVWLVVLGRQRAAAANRKWARANSF
jgi:hypothetical protein